MKKSMKQKLAVTLGCNVDFNRKVLKMKKSWDEVEKILCDAGKKKGMPDKGKKPFGKKKPGF